MGNSFGRIFRITTYGESHGKQIGVVIDGCPAGLTVNETIIQTELDRRKPGQSKITTARKEEDKVKILSGVFEGKTLGTPIGLSIANRDQQSQDYNNLKDIFRPSHADFSYHKKYDHRDWRGGGRSSNRESAARVAAGAIAKQFIFEVCQLETLAWVDQVQAIKAAVDIETVNLAQIESSITRCPDAKAAGEMEKIITKAKNDGDSLGGVVKFRVKNCPPGLGTPVFDKLTADLAKALMSINATRSFEVGLGLEAIRLTGATHNDEFIAAKKQGATKTNRSGGIQGGISNGNTIFGAVSFKPVATILHQQATVNRENEQVLFTAKGRHDPCVLPRAVPIVEAMINLVLADQLILLTTSRLATIKRALSD